MVVFSVQMTQFVPSPQLSVISKLLSSQAQTKFPTMTFDDNTARTVISLTARLPGMAVKTSKQAKSEVCYVLLNVFMCHEILTFTNDVCIKNIHCTIYVYQFFACKCMPYFILTFYFL